jgi:YD repeat-containing protein
MTQSATALPLMDLNLVRRIPHATYTIRPVNRLERSPSCCFGGAITNKAKRFSFTGFGQPSLLEEGYTTGQDDAAWSAFTTTKATQVGYDQNERKLFEKVMDATGSVYSLTHYGYDGNGRLQCVAERLNQSSFSSSSFDPCLPGAVGSQGKDRITKNTYDAAGQLVQVRKAVGTPLEQAYATYSYTANGKQEFVIDANGNRANSSTMVSIGRLNGFFHLR